jgi:hypothetical protein
MVRKDICAPWMCSAPTVEPRKPLSHAEIFKQGNLQTVQIVQHMMNSGHCSSSPSVRQCASGSRTWFSLDFACLRCRVSLTISFIHVLSAKLCSPVTYNEIQRWKTRIWTLLHHIVLSFATSTTSEFHRLFASASGLARRRPHGPHAQLSVNHDSVCHQTMLPYYFAPSTSPVSRTSLMR